MIRLYCYFTSDKWGGKCFCPCKFVWLSVCLLARLLKSACMDLHDILRVDICRDMDDICRDMDKLITFEHNADYSPDAGIRLLSPMSHKHCTATRNFTSGKPHMYVLAARRRGEAWFYTGFIIAHKYGDIDIANLSVRASVRPYVRRLSVCPLRSGIRWKRLNNSSYFFHRTVAESF